MDLVTLLNAKVKNGKPPTQEEKSKLAIALTTLSTDGAQTVYSIISAFFTNLDKKMKMGSNAIPYYGLETPHKTDPNLVDVKFNVNDLPDQLVLILVEFVNMK
jgi:hypothetical protein